MENSGFPLAADRLMGRLGQEQPDLVEDVPGHCSEVGLDDLGRSLPTQTTL